MTKRVDVPEKRKQNHLHFQKIRGLKTIFTDDSYECSVLEILKPCAKIKMALGTDTLDLFPKASYHGEIA